MKVKIREEYLKLNKLASLPKHAKHAYTFWLERKIALIINQHEESLEEAYENGREDGFMSSSL